MTDVVYCDVCGQYRKSEYEIDDDNSDGDEKVFEQKCTTCASMQKQYIIHSRVDEEFADPDIYEFVCVENIPMYDTDALFPDDADSLRKKAKILKEATKLLKKWTEEDKKKKEQERRIRRAEFVISLLNEKHELEKELEHNPELQFDIEKYRRVLNIINKVVPSKPSWLNKCYQVDAQTLLDLILPGITTRSKILLDARSVDGFKKNMEQRLAAFDSLNSRLQYIKSELSKEEEK